MALATGRPRDGTLTVNVRTFSSKFARWGRAIDNGGTDGGGALTVVSSTFTGNSVNSDGGRSTTVTTAT